MGEVETPASQIQEQPGVLTGGGEKREKEHGLFIWVLGPRLFSSAYTKEMHFGSPLSIS